MCMLNVTGRMDIDIGLVEDCRRLAKQCKMKDLIEELQHKCKQVYEFGKRLLLSSIYMHPGFKFQYLQTHFHCDVSFIFSSAWTWIDSFLFYLLCPRIEVSNKPGVCVKVLSLEAQNYQLQDEMAQLADCALPTELRVRNKNELCYSCY